MERVRALGPYWVVSELEVHLTAEPIRSVALLGFDPEQQKFVGNWVDSTCSSGATV